MKDGTLRQDILDELEFEPSIDANDIGVAVELQLVASERLGSDVHPNRTVTGR